jgi:surface antigen
MTRIMTAVLGVLALMLAGCASDYGQKQAIGGILGGIGGGVAGAQFGGGTGRLVAAGVGTLLGAYLGSEVGKSLDRADRAYAVETAHSALEYNPSGYAASWRNPDSGHYGTVTPVRTYEAAPGRFCREYQSTIHVGGRMEQGYGTACRQPDGSWEIVS